MHSWFNEDRFQKIVAATVTALVSALFVTSQTKGEQHRHFRRPLDPRSCQPFCELSIVPLGPAGDSG